MRITLRIVMVVAQIILTCSQIQRDKVGEELRVLLAAEIKHFEPIENSLFELGCVNNSWRMENTAVNPILSYPLYRISWFITYAQRAEVHQLFFEDGILRINATQELNKARVSCSAVTRTHTIRAPDTYIHVRLKDPADITAPLPPLLRFVGISIEGESGASGEIHRREGESLRVLCSARNLPISYAIYMYTIITSDDATVEREVMAVFPFLPRQQTVADISVTTEMNGTRLICRARWFTSLGYSMPVTVSSTPLVLLVDKLAPASSSLVTWIALSYSGWVVASLLLLILLYFWWSKSSCKKTNFYTTPDCEDKTSRTNLNEVRGATVVPLHAVRSLTAANMKLGQGTIPTPEPIYWNSKHF